MQAAKDSFYMALRARLAALNPARTMVIDGVTVPAIVVRENMEPRFGEAQPGVFYLDFGDILIAESTRPMLGVDCHIWYASEGSGGTGVDRGRRLAEMDDELLGICDPPHTEMLDYSQTPSVDLGSGIFWTVPEMGNAPGDVPIQKQQWSAGVARVDRYAQLRIYFFLPEVDSMTRAGLRPIARQTRAYFAPVNRSERGRRRFLIHRKTAGFSLMLHRLRGLIWDGLKTFSARAHRRSRPLTGGTAGAVSAQARHGLGARVDFEFRDWGKLQMALAGGAEHMNVLATDRERIAGRVGWNSDCSGTFAGWLDGYRAGVGSGRHRGFQVGDLVACDVDYAQQVGYVGTGISGAYVQNPENVQQDVNYVRRVTFNVGRVALVTATSLLLTQPLPGGVPAAGASVQQVSRLWTAKAARFCNSGRDYSWRKMNQADVCVSSIRC